MKYVVLAFLFIGMISCQASVDVCVTDLQSDVKIVRDLQAALKSRNFIQILSDITKIQPLFEKTRTDCSQVTKQDILIYTFNHLSAGQKQCLMDVLSVVMVGYSVYVDATTKNWNELFEDLNTLRAEVDSAVVDCKGSK